MTDLFSAIQSCPICGQSAKCGANYAYSSYPDPVTGLNQIAFLKCPRCKTDGVCGDCRHEGVCCYEKSGQMFTEDGCIPTPAPKAKKKGGRK